MTDENNKEPDFQRLLKIIETEGNPEVRFDAVTALFSMGYPEREQLLIKLLKDPDPAIRWCAAGTLGDTGDETAILPLIEALEDENPEVRQTVAFSLGKIGDERAISRLTELTLTDENRTSNGYRVNTTAADAIKFIKERIPDEKLKKSNKPGYKVRPQSANE